LSGVPTRGNGVCSVCHGTGYPDPFKDPFSVPVSLISLEKPKCIDCGGNGQCKTCGGQGEIIQETSRASTEALGCEARTGNRSYSGRKEAATEPHDEPSGASSGL